MSDNEGQHIDTIDEIHDFISDPQNLVEEPKAKRDDRLTPERIKSYIAILASALGGIDYSSELNPPPYKLGDEALLCLQDIKKWLRTHDQKENSWVVAVACAESGLVNDLIQILCLWESTLNKKTTSISGFSKKHDVKIARHCLQILVLLTWPIQLTDSMYSEQLSNYYNLKKYQLGYKKEILSFKNGLVLKAIIKLALPIIAMQKLERSPFDNAVLAQCLIFFQNVLAIEPANLSRTTKRTNKPSELNANLPKGVDIDDISVGACVIAYNENLVFTFFLTLSSSLGEEFESEFFAKIFADILFHITKGLRPSYVFPSNSGNDHSNSSSSSSTGLSLKGLLSKEQQLKAKFQKNSSTRHGRFGTLLSIRTPDMGKITVSGSSNILEGRNPITSFEAHKSWNKPKQFKYKVDEEIVFPEVTIGSKSREVLKEFVCDFIDGALNPFIKTCTRELTSDYHSKSTTDKIRYFMLISWFLEAHRARNADNIQEIDYTLIANALSEETFLLLFKSLSESYDDAIWGLSHAGLITFKEIIQLLNTMSLSSNQEDKDVATNIKERLFHREQYLELLAKFPKIASKRSPEFVNTCIEYVDIVLSTLENYSKENVLEVIRDKKSRKTKKNVTHEQAEIDEVDTNDHENTTRTAEKLSKKRELNFKKYQEAFVTIETINTYILYLDRFNDLTEKEIKRAIKFLHRAFFQLKKYPILYRVDFLLLLHTMLSEDGLVKHSNIRKHVQQFLQHFMKKMKKSVTTSPSLLIEMLFPLISDKSVRYYLETGEIMSKDLPKAVTVTKIAQIKNEETMDMERKVSIIVAALIDDDKMDLIKWISQEMESVHTKRTQQLELDVPNEGVSQKSSIELQNIKIVSEDPLLMKALVTDPKLRYLLKLAGFTLPYSTEDDCYFGTLKDLKQLSEIITYCKMYLMTTVNFDDGKVANDFVNIRLISKAYSDENRDDEDADYDAYGEGYSSDENDIAFDVEGQKVSEGYNDDMLDQLEDAIDKSESSGPKGIAKSKKKARDKEGAHNRRKSKNPHSKKVRANTGLPLHDISEDEEGQNLRDRKDEQLNLEISSKYVIDSDDDDEDDEAFFERERLLRIYLNENNGQLTREQIQQFLHRESNPSLSQSSPKRPFDNNNIETRLAKRRKEVTDYDENDNNEVKTASHVFVSTGNYQGKVMNDAASQEVVGKSSLFVSEDEDEGEDEGFSTAQVPRRKQRVILEEEDDDDDDE
ncbi:hypothetical protein WICMUC_005493 [Wickerhamomyces mucosus]|uniref:Topoisomerase 1-associated factor 1 n=1 Tax=Wickerhamomyces mucosus TaxID=1378264 RepID=A0A9P8T5D3_9ASCO|nr:hypothetical protein WICMUC_005493 [Wickerhamomyces mucosus]